MGAQKPRIDKNKTIEGEKLIVKQRDKMQADLLNLLSKHEQANAERQQKLSRAVGQDRIRLENIFKIERAKESEEIAVLSENNENIMKKIRLEYGLEETH
eukprot:TRINITY_DN26706_c0_g1_i1.p2 TRINITY_DN26706_c0_g1~~TRINITY_DN26706_c0_g1_i1.p2  ORF type:complete len:100 (-),score=17.56 TRINITY_DN26706_c0_g1_i1:28-327(-)